MAMRESARESDPDALQIGAMSREIVKEAVTSMPRLFVSAIAAYGALSYFAMLLLLASNEVAKIDGHYRFSNEWLNLVGLLLLGFIQSAILSSVAISVHRLILCDETKKGVITPFNRRGMSFTFWIMALRLPLFFVGGVSVVVLRSHPGTFLLFGPILLAAAIVIVRTSLIFPAIAIDAQHDGPLSRVAAAWRMSRQRLGDSSDRRSGRCFRS